MKIWKTVLVLALLLLSGCGKAVPTETTVATTVPVERLTRVVTEENIGELEDYSGLRELDLTGSTCYGAIEDYKARHPEVVVTYTVSFGSRTVPADALFVSQRCRLGVLP